MNRKKLSSKIEKTRRIKNMGKDNILPAYNKLKRQVKRGFYSDENTRILEEIYHECLKFLNLRQKVNLISKVKNKEYFAFGDGRKISRAINLQLYEPDFPRWIALKNGIKEDDLSALSATEIQKILYTMAISFCACVDLLKNGDQKTPGTFFEYFIAYFYSWRVGVEPQNYIQLLNLDEKETKLPTDFVFNLGKNKKKFHMPVKISTRERSIMLWAHQRLIDGIYGKERFVGTPVIMAETKTSQQKKEVIEICLPEQWRLYQSFIAQLKRIYYLDLPEAYQELNNKTPSLVIKPFSEFFEEWQLL